MVSSRYVSQHDLKSSLDVPREALLVPVFKEDARQSTALVQPTCYSNVAHRDHQSYRSPRLGARQRSFSATSQWCRACFAFVGFFIVGIEVEIMNLCQIRTVWISKEPR